MCIFLLAERKARFLNQPENSLNFHGNSLNQPILSKIEPEGAPEMRQKHRNSLPNGRKQGAPRGRREAPPPWGGAEGAALLSSIW